jgi:hypothetical protein
MSSHHKIHPLERPPPEIAYRAVLDAPRELVRYVSSLGDHVRTGRVLTYFEYRYLPNSC